MGTFDRLQPIKLDEYENCNYAESREYYIDECNFFFRHDGTIHNCIINTINSFDYHMNENGMDKFVCLIAVVLFGIEHEYLIPDIAYGIMHDIKDFETGDYDHLFTDEDLKLIKLDIKIIRDYIEKHPELLYEENLSPLE